MLPAPTVGNDGESVLIQTAVFDRMSVPDAMAVLRSCCASTRWAAQVVSGRPYGRVRQLLAASNDVMADLRWGDLTEALARGSEQDEARFGRAFSIRAAGKTPAQLLTALRERLGSPVEIERDAIRAELGEIVRLRLITTFR